jgi:hypothetical protein
MKTFVAAGAALALIASVTVASAQSGGVNSGTPGAGSAGQDQRPGDQELPNAAKKQPNTTDAPRGQNMTGGQGTSGSNTMAPAPMAPKAGDK